MGDLDITPDRLAGRLVLTPVGAIDAITADRLRSAGYEAVLANPVVIIDLSRVSSLDLRGLSALALTGHVAHRSGHRMLLAAPSPVAAAALHAMGVADRLDIVDTVTEAIGRTAGGRPRRSGDRMMSPTTASSPDAGPRTKRRLSGAASAATHSTRYARSP